MFWIFLLLASVATVFGMLGAFSVWFVVLKGALVLALLVITGLVMAMFWRRVFGDRGTT